MRMEKSSQHHINQGIKAKETHLAITSVGYISVNSPTAGQRYLKKFTSVPITETFPCCFSLSIYRAQGIISHLQHLWGNR